MTTQTRVAIVGGGLLGCSLLYRLAELGWTDTVLIEKNELTAGTTWHSAGQLVLVDDNPDIARINVASRRRYLDFAAATGEHIGHHRTGSVRLAKSSARLERFRHQADKLNYLGVTCEVVGVERLAQLFPLMATDGLAGALWVPDEDYIDPSMATQAFARQARARGAVIRRHTKMTALARTASGTWRLETSQGAIDAETVVTATGFWAPAILARLGVDLPILSTERQYFVTEPVAALAGRSPELPILRDMDEPFYVRQEGQALLAGVHEKHTPYCFVDGVPEDFGQELLPPDLDRAAHGIEAAIRRVPALGEIGIKRVICGPTSRTPDFQGLMGPLAGLPGLYVLAGFSAGVTHGAAAGEMLAQWIVTGECALDPSPLDVSRFGPHVNQAYLRDVLRVVHSYGVQAPEGARQPGRPARCAPLHDRLKGRGAQFIARYGWECPAWFAHTVGAARDQAVAAECAALRTQAGMIDMSGLAKFEVGGIGAASLLARLAGTPLPAVGSAAPLTLRTASAGIDAAFTLLRLGDDRFLLLAEPEAERHHQVRLERANHHGEARINLATGRLGAIMVAGPRAADILAGAAFRRDFSDQGFPVDTIGELSLGRVSVVALRLDQLGVPSWLLIHPIEQQLALDEALRAGGAPLGLTDAGWLACDALRLASGQARWGREVTVATSRTASAAQLVHLELARAPDEAAAGALVWNGSAPIGLMRSVAVDSSTGRGVGFAHLDRARARQGEPLRLNVGGQSYGAKVLAVFAK